MPRPNTRSTTSKARTKTNPADPPGQPFFDHRRIVYAITLAGVLCYYVASCLWTWLSAGSAPAPPFRGASSADGHGRDPAINLICTTLQQAFQHPNYTSHNPPLLHDVFGLPSGLPSVAEVKSVWPVKIAAIQAEKSRKEKHRYPVEALRSVNASMDLLAAAGTILTRDQGDDAPYRGGLRGVYKAEVVAKVTKPGLYLAWWAGERTLVNGEERKKVLRRICGGGW